MMKEATREPKVRYNDPIAHALHEAFPIYSRIQKIGRGGTRHTYRGSFGDSYDVIFKIDMDQREITSKTALRHIANGYTTRAEIDISRKIKENPHLNMPLTYGSILVDGEQRAASVYKFSSGKNLAELVEQDGPLNREQFRQVFSGVLNGEEALIENRIFHRDQKPDNIVVETRKKDLFSIITDFANATTFEDVESKFLPTAGGSKTRDPLLFFGTSPQQYGAQSEIHAIAKTMLFARTGSFGPVYNLEEPDKMNAQSKKVFMTDGEGRLGAVNLGEYNTQIRNLFASTQSSNPRVDEVLLKALSLDVEQRYSSFHQFKEDMMAAMKPTIFERVKKHPAIGLAAVAAASLAVVVGLGEASYRREMKETMIPLTEFRPEQQKNWMREEYDYFKSLLDQRQSNSIFALARTVDSLKVDNDVKRRILNGDFAALKMLMKQADGILPSTIPAKNLEREIKEVERYRAVNHISAPDPMNALASREISHAPLEQYYWDTIGRREKGDREWTEQVHTLVENHISLRDLVKYGSNIPQVQNPTEREKYVRTTASIFAEEYMELLEFMDPHAFDPTIASTPALDPREVHARLFPSRREELLPSPKRVPEIMAP